jgi:hypothetical protein
LTEAVMRAFPEYLPYGGQYDSIVPHLTVAQAGAAEHDVAEADLIASLPTQAGIEAHCNEVVLIENYTKSASARHASRNAAPT